MENKSRGIKAFEISMNIGELQVKENEDGELYFRIPDDVLNRLGWKEGDDIKFTERDGGFVLTKVKKVSISVDFDKDNLLQYMTMAHEKDMTFNQLCEEAIKERINKDE